MVTEIGKKNWVFADLYWPSVTNGDEYVSHESICVLNLTDTPAEIKITLYYEDRDPIKDLTFACGAQRGYHIRMDQVKLEDGASLPRGIGYAALVESNVPIVAQCTRVDTTQPELALMTTPGYSF